MKRVPPLSDEQLEQALAELPGWQGDSHSLRRSLRFAGFREVMAFMAAAAGPVESMDHHPSWTNCYDRLDITLTTHDAGNRVTTRDVELARQLEELLHDGSHTAS